MDVHYRNFNNTSLDRSDVSRYVKRNKFVLLYSKFVKTLDDRDISVEEALSSLRSISAVITSIYINHLFEACLLYKYKLHYHFDHILEYPEFVNFCHSIEYDYQYLVTNYYSIRYDDDILVYTYYKTIDHLKRIVYDTSDVRIMSNNPCIFVLIRYFVDSLIPQISKYLIKREITISPEYIIRMNDVELKCNPNLLLDDNIVEVKCCKTDMWIEWARTLNIYYEGLKQNGYNVNGCYVINVYTNEIIYFIFRI